MATNLTSTVNSYNKNKWRVTFSNIPNFTGKSEDQFDLSVINNNIRGVTIPDLTSPLLESFYMNERQEHPNPIGTKELNTVTIEIKADDILLNWHYFWSWIVANRTGQIARANLKDEELLRDNCIDIISVYFFDNAKQVKSKIEFQRCFISAISQTDLRYGISENNNFTVTFIFEGLTWKLQNNFDEADEILEDPNKIL